ncbi:MAG: transglycosylase SLT domain-containing protein [Candidatus Moranbacteria bacterium]|nr:transglycosylase SLT domain-containing protein [Candidatus Moranbacteria bacterium]
MIFDPNKISPRIESPEKEVSPEKLTTPIRKEIKITDMGKQIKAETEKLSISKNKDIAKEVIDDRRRDFLRLSGATLLTLGALEAHTKRKTIIDFLKKLYSTETESTKDTFQTPQEEEMGAELEAEEMTSENEKKEVDHNPQEEGVLNPQTPCEFNSVLTEKYNKCEAEYFIQQATLEKEIGTEPINEELLEIFDFDNENKIEINDEIKNKIFKRYFNLFRPTQGSKHGKYHESVRGGLERMNPWMDNIKEIFKQHEIPEKYLYLPIAETFFRTSQKSSAGAGGPFQFLRVTGEEYGLKIEKNIDEREDPLLSAEATARKLKSLYTTLGDWDLAVRGYNGGFVYRYRSTRNEKNITDLSDDDFLKYLSENLNTKKEIAKNPKNSSFVYKVLNKGATLDAVAKKFNIPEREIKKIGEGKFKIPLKNTSQRKKVYTAWANAKGVIQNLSYPEKINAIRSVIEKYKLDQKTSQPLEFTEYMPEKEFTLQEIAASHKVNLKNLENINPAILDSNKKLPKGYSIRIPAKDQFIASLK